MSLDFLYNEDAQETSKRRRDLKFYDSDKDAYLAGKAADSREDNEYNLNTVQGNRNSDMFNMGYSYSERYSD